MIEKIFISDVWNLKYRGHDNYDFIDVAVNDDTPLFIDPCLIESRRDEWSIKADRIMKSYFNKLFSAYEVGDKAVISDLLSHANEQNGTRLGYGKGYNGKGNTATGLLKIFSPLEELIHAIKTIGKPQDLSVLLTGFAEDGMSDLLTNIFHECLNEFTIKEMEKHDINTNGNAEFYTWDMQDQKWKKVRRPVYLIEKKELLLVPKNIVRKNYLFGVNQYFNRIILERMIDEGGYRDADGKAIPKKEIVKSKRYTGEHWQYTEVINYSVHYNDALDEYHRKLPAFYLKNGHPMSSEELDKIVYGYVRTHST